MTETKITREQLRLRRDEIMAQLDRTGKDLRAKLDPNSEEQAIETEQEEVAISMEENLREELAGIEDRLRDS